MCGCRPRPWELYLHPTGRTKKQEREISKGAHGIATNIDPSTQAWHEAHKHIDLSKGT